jgi:hypothetical protein
MGIDKISGKEKFKNMLHDTEHSEEAEHSNLYHSNITIKKNETKYSKTIMKKLTRFCSITLSQMTISFRLFFQQQYEFRDRSSV